jgi:hypothetical protein
MPKPKSRKKKPPNRVLALPDLEQAKTDAPHRGYRDGVRSGIDSCEPCLRAERRATRSPLGTAAAWSYF